MIPKTIHYCWFGRNEKSELIKKCINSWKKYCPDYEIIEWNEENFDVNAHPYTQKAYKEKKWAFVSDYARIKILYDHGGIYLDIDMELLKSIDNLLNNSFFIGKEGSNVISAGIIGSVPYHVFLQEMLKEYDSLKEFVTIPNVMGMVLNRYNNNNQKYLSDKAITIYPKEYFYPFGFNEKYTKKCITKNTYAIHWWNYSWGKWYVRLLHRMNMLDHIATIKNLIIQRYNEYIKYNAKIHDSIVSKYNERHFNEIFNSSEQKRLREAIDQAIKLIDTKSKIKILADLGSGTGNLTKYLLQHKNVEVWALDVSSKMLDFLKHKFNKNNLKTILINGQDLSSIKSQSVDMISAYSVLHHIPDYLFMVKEMCRVLKPGGIIFIDHEHNKNFWEGDKVYKEFLQVNKKSLPLKRKVLKYSNPINYINFIKAKIYTMIRYQPEGDIHVYRDDHIELDKILEVLKDNNMTTICIKNYLQYKANYVKEVYNKYRHRTSDMMYIMAQKNK